MRSFPLFLSFGILFACSPEAGHYPPGSSGPIGPGVGSRSTARDAGVSTDGGEPDTGTETSFLCGGETFVCEFPDSYANCCDETFIECPADFPYYCPAEAFCWYEEELCVDNSTCMFTGADCSQ